MVRIFLNLRASSLTLTRRARYFNRVRVIFFQQGRVHVLYFKIANFNFNYEVAIHYVNEMGSIIIQLY